MQQSQYPQPQASPDDGYAAVYVAPDDDVPAICGKVDTAAHQRVVVIAPRGNRALASMMGMPLLRRHADATGKEVYLVSRRPRLRTLARQEGLQAAATVRGLRLDARPLAHLEVPMWGGQRLSLPAYVSIAKGLLLALVGVAALVAAFLLGPSATVVVYPATVDAAQEFTAVASVSDKQPDFASHVIPARRLTTVLETSIAVATSGKITLGDKPASGTVTFINRSGRDLTLPSGTTVSTATGIRFATQNEVALAAAEGSSGQAPVVALVAGTVGNVGAGTIARIEGDLQNLIAVANAEPVQGGTDRQATSVAQDDLDRLRALAPQVLKGEGMQALLGQHDKTETVYPETVQVEVRKDGESFSHPLGAETEWVALRMQADVSGLAFFSDDVAAVAARTLEGSVGKDAFVVRETVKADPTAFQSYLKDDGRVWFTVKASGKVAPSFDREAVRQEITGLNRDEALARLAAQYGQNAPPEIHLTPGWLSRLPLLARRINVEVKAAATP